jgi:anthraniloyl-CoA monooxygenase
VVCADGAGSPVTDAGLGLAVREVGRRCSWLGLDIALDGLMFLAEPTSDGLYLAHAYPYSGKASTFLVEGPRPLDPTELSALFDLPVGTGSPTDGLGWRVFRERTVWPWWRDNVVAVGDAAHTAHCSIGYGTYLAFRDAMALVESLAAAPSP